MSKRLDRAKAVVWLGAALLGNALAQGQSVSPHGSFFEVDGTRLYYEECGSAPQALVLFATIGGAMDDLQQLRKDITPPTISPRSCITYN